jgi:mannose-6-phosphate isomerase-like protein (cupin superfamily)
MLVEQGRALLLMSDDRTDRLRAGDVVRTPASTVHGVTNIGNEQFVSIAVTKPPQDFTANYKSRRPSG